MIYLPWSCWWLGPTDLLILQDTAIALSYPSEPGDRPYCQTHHIIELGESKLIPTLEALSLLASFYSAERGCVYHQGKKVSSTMSTVNFNSNWPGEAAY